MNKNTQSKPQNMLQIEKGNKKLCTTCVTAKEEKIAKKQLYISLLFKTNAWISVENL